MFHYYSFIIATCNKAEFLWKSDVYLSTFILAKKKSSKFYYNTWRNYFKNQQTSQQSSMNKVTLKLTTSYWEREVLLMLWLLFAYNFSKCYWKLHGWFFFFFLPLWVFYLCFDGILTSYNKICNPFALFLYSMRHFMFTPEPCSSKYTPWARRISITWTLLRDTKSQAHWIRICSLTRSPGDLKAHWRTTTLKQ